MADFGDFGSVAEPVNSGPEVLFGDPVAAPFDGAFGERAFADFAVAEPVPVPATTTMATATATTTEFDSEDAIAQCIKAVFGSKVGV